MPVTIKRNSLTYQIYEALTGNLLGLQPRHIHSAIMRSHRDLLLESKEDKEKTFNSIKVTLKNKTEIFSKLPNGNYVLLPSITIQFTGTESFNEVKDSYDQHELPEILDYLKGKGPTAISEIMSWCGLIRGDVVVWLNQQPNIKRVGSNNYELV